MTDPTVTSPRNVNNSSLILPDTQERRKSNASMVAGGIGTSQLPDDDPVRFLQKYFGSKDGTNSKKNALSATKVHPNYMMNKLDKQYKKEMVQQPSTIMEDYLNNASPGGYNYINMNSDT